MEVAIWDLRVDKLVNYVLAFKDEYIYISRTNIVNGIVCQQCGCSRSVAPIKAGFVARVGRRKTTT